MLESLSYRSVLARGYAVIRDQSRTIITKKDQFDLNKNPIIEFADGSLEIGNPIASNAPPLEKEPPKHSLKKKSKTKNTSNKDDQTSLFDH